MVRHIRHVLTVGLCARQPLDLSVILATTWLLFFSPLAGLVGASLAATLTALTPSVMIVLLLVCNYSDALVR